MIVGLMVGREYSFPPAFIERVNEIGKAHGVSAEYVKLGGTRMGEPPHYQVIVDRISHEVEYYRGYLKHAALSGTYCINNPFWWTADDKFFNYTVASKLGVAIPKTVLLPQKDPTFYDRFLETYTAPELTPTPVPATQREIAEAICGPSRFTHADSAYGSD